MKKTKLAKGLLFKMLPYLRDLDYHKRYESDSRLSSINSAVLIEGQHEGFPNPYETVSVEESDTSSTGVYVDLVDSKGDVTEVKAGHSRSFDSSIGLTPDGSEGGKTDLTIKRAKKKPAYVVAKKFSYSRHYGRFCTENYQYDIQVYKLE